MPDHEPIGLMTAKEIFGVSQGTENEVQIMRILGLEDPQITSLARYRRQLVEDARREIARDELYEAKIGFLAHLYASGQIGGRQG